MTAGFIGAPVDTTGTTPVIVVDTPASGKQRQILSVLCENKDTIDHTFIGQKKKGGVVVLTHKVLVGQGLPAGQLISTGCVTLNATDESYVVALNEPIGTTQSKIDPAVFEVP